MISALRFKRLGFTSIQSIVALTMSSFFASGGTQTELIEASATPDMYPEQTPEPAKSSFPQVACSQFLKCSQFEDKSLPFIRTLRWSCAKLAMRTKMTTVATPQFLILTAPPVGPVLVKSPYRSRVRRNELEIDFNLSRGVTKVTPICRDESGSEAISA
jgi:hypothetical protein